MNIKYNIAIMKNFRCQIWVHRKILSSDHPLFSNLPKHFRTLEDVRRLISTISEAHVCCGSRETDLVRLVPHASTVGYVHNYDALDSSGIPYAQTARANKCILLTGNTRYKRCSECSLFRGSLRKKRSAGYGEDSSLNSAPHKY